MMTLALQVISACACCSIISRHSELLLLLLMASARALSIADFTWAEHTARKKREIIAVILRAAKKQ